MSFNFKIRKIKNSDREWIKRFITKEWGSDKVVSRGKIYYPHLLNGFVATKNNKYLGLITYNFKNNNCEIISLNSLVKKRGIGRALVEKIKEVARKSACKRVWAITTNDNLGALIFWQKVGFVLVTIHRNALDFSRKLKPEIPLVGNYGIPLRDEIELEFRLKNNQNSG